MALEPQQPRLLWQVGIDPLFILSALIALAYGIWAPALYESPNPPLLVLAIFKSAPVFLLAFRALIGRSELLLLGLLFGCAGDGFLVWPDRFMHGALAFLIGHLCYIRLFHREGIGAVAALRQPLRLLGAVALIASAIGMTYVLVPRESEMFVPLAIYTGVLTLMTLTSFTLGAKHWLAIGGAALFFISDGFVAWNMFHPASDPTLAFWRSFAGWMIYWAGQAGICLGMAKIAVAQPQLSTPK